MILELQTDHFSSALPEDEKMRRDFADEGGLTCFLAWGH
jgi:hypothetical protein